MSQHEANVLFNFRARVIRWIATAALVFVLPFTLYNLLKGNWLVASFALMVLVILSSNARRVPEGRKPFLPIGLLLPAVACFLVVSFLEQGIVAAFWCYPAVTMFYFLLSPSAARWANLALLAVIFPCAFKVLPAALSARLAATLLAISVTSAIFLHLMTLQQQELERAAVTDPLTGTFNRLQMGLQLSTALARFQRYGHSCSLIAIDIDHFKSINDNFGHAAGDKILRQVALVLRNRVRTSDAVFRLGGEEFLILLESTDAEKATLVAEHLRELIEETCTLPGRVVTASFGVVEVHETDNQDRWVKRADARLYQAKAQGRNCVVVQDATPAQEKVRPLFKASS